jgi:hypothetical protein
VTRGVPAFPIVLNSTRSSSKKKPPRIGPAIIHLRASLPCAGNGRAGGGGGGSAGDERRGGTSSRIGGWRGAGLGWTCAGVARPVLLGAGGGRRAGAGGTAGGGSPRAVGPRPSDTVDCPAEESRGKASPATCAAVGVAIPYLRATIRSASTNAIPLAKRFSGRLARIRARIRSSSRGCEGSISEGGGG